MRPRTSLGHVCSLFDPSVTHTFDSRNQREAAPTSSISHTGDQISSFHFFRNSFINKLIYIRRLPTWPCVPLTSVSTPSCLFPSRSPWTNSYDPPLSDGTMPSERLRKLEVDANAAFDQYREMYFEGGVSSVYLWDLDNGFAGVILIKKAGDPGSKKIKVCINDEQQKRIWMWEKIWSRKNDD